MDNTETIKEKRIKKFYGRRKGHTLSPRQQSLLDNALPKFSLTLSDENLDLSTCFSKSAKEVWLEIGFGKGEHLLTQAQNNPDVNFIGCEPFVNGVVCLLDNIEEKKLGNVRIYPDDALDLLEKIPDATFDRIFLLHPDPWPKRKHEKRRFVSQDNLETLARVMKDGAELRIGTDHVNYSRWTMFQMYQTPFFTWNADKKSDWSVRPDDWPESRYQQKALNVGINSVYLSFTRLPR